MNNYFLTIMIAFYLKSPHVNLTWDIRCSSGLVVTGKLACFGWLEMLWIHSDYLNIIEESAQFSTFSSSKLPYGTLFSCRGGHCWWSVGKMSSKTRSKPGILKPKTEFQKYIFILNEIEYEYVLWCYIKIYFWCYTKIWFPVSKFPALARVYYAFYQHSCGSCPLTGKFAREIISRTFCNFF